MEKYDKIQPGLAGEIIAMAKQQMIHRQNIEMKMIESNAKAKILGVLFGGLIGLSGVIGGIVSIILGASLYGLAAVILALGSLAGVFVYGKQSNRKEMVEKQKIIESMKKTP